MRPDDGPPPDRRTARQRLDRVRSAVRSAPLPVKIVLVVALLAAAVLASAVPARVGDLVLVLVLCYGPIAIWRGQRSVIASLGVAVWGEAAILAVAAVTNSVTFWPLVPLLLLPLAVVAAAHCPRSPATSCPAGPWRGRCCGRCRPPCSPGGSPPASPSSAT